MTYHTKVEIAFEIKELKRKVHKTINGHVVRYTLYSSCYIPCRCYFLIARFQLGNIMIIVHKMKNAF